MQGKPKETLFDRKDVLVRNANIDIATVAEHDRLVQELKRAGVYPKTSLPRYRLEHPLGGDRMRFSNWAEPASSQSPRDRRG